MKCNFDNNSPIYMQIVEQLKIEIVSQKLKPGDRIPSVRDLSLELKVNPNTVQKALVELEKYGLIYTDSTNGKYVTNDTQLIYKLKDKFAYVATNNYICYMKELGFNCEETLKFIKEKGDK